MRVSALILVMSCWAVAAAVPPPEFTDKERAAAVERYDRLVAERVDHLKKMAAKIEENLPLAKVPKAKKLQEANLAEVKAAIKSLQADSAILWDRAPQLGKTSAVGDVGFLPAEGGKVVALDDESYQVALDLKALPPGAAAEEKAVLTILAKPPKGLKVGAAVKLPGVFVLVRTDPGPPWKPTIANIKSPVNKLPK